MAKILVVEDDSDVRIGMAAVLRRSGYEAVFAEDGVGAISIALKEAPDVILLDLGLPAGDGFVVLERLKKNVNLSTIPVIVLSARNPRDNEQRALKAGALTYFQKPIETEELFQVIERTING